MDVAAFVISCTAFVLALVAVIWLIANAVIAARAAEETESEDSGEAPHG